MLFSRPTAAHSLLVRSPPEVLMTRRRLAVAATLAAITAASLLTVPRLASAAVSDADLAYRWAPVHHQDTADADYSADYVSPIDFDGDWESRNNWDNQPGHRDKLTGAAYYSVVETGTHWFLVYSFFHPRDWKLIGRHENDLEGVVEVIRKDGGDYGTFEAMVTVAHSDFYSYTPPGSPFTEGAEDIDGTVVMESHDGADRPSTFQEAKGHGLYRWKGDDFPGGDGVVYRPSRGAGEVPSGGDDRSVGYRLVDTFAEGGLWQRRNDSATFASWGTFAGDDGNDNAANAPWGWDDGNDGPGRGLMATDPARLIADYFDGTGDFGLSYVRNPFQEAAAGDA
jgi:hypothetical protein